MEFIDIVNQEGKLTCPLCKNNIDWKLNVKKYNQLLNHGRWATAIDSKPRYTGYTFNDDGTLNVMVGCEMCGSTIEVRNLPLSNE